MCVNMSVHTCSFLFDMPVFQHCPWLVQGVSSSGKDLEKLIANWKAHKYSRPVRGAILLNMDSTKVEEPLRTTLPN